MSIERRLQHLESQMAALLRRNESGQKTLVEEMQEMFQWFDARKNGVEMEVSPEAKRQYEEIERRAEAQRRGDFDAWCGKTR